MGSLRTARSVLALLALTACTADGSGPVADADAGPGAVDAAHPSSGDSGVRPIDSGPSAPDASPVDAGAGAACLGPVEPCTSSSVCCDGRRCGMTTAGTVCCGDEGAACATTDGEDCCDDLLCVDGECRRPLECHSPCVEAPALVIEKNRLRSIGGNFLGICGDAAHTYGYHVPAARLGSDDYSMQGAANDPVCAWHACAIDIGMDWPASRSWLRWLIEEIRTDRIRGIAEVIGSYDGHDVRYWSDSSGWGTDGVPYSGSGHDTWTHVSIYRSTALDDHGLLAGWTASGGP